MEEARKRPRMMIAWWAATALLAGLAGMLASQLLRQTPAAAQTGSGSSSGVVVIAGQITRDTYGLYLVDPQNSTICLYQYLANERRLRLVAARTYLFDRQLDSYNTDPEPAEIEKLVQDARRLRTTTTRPTTPEK